MPFYKREDDVLNVAPNFVLNRDYELREENHTEYEYPVDGWYWFANLDDAMLNMRQASSVLSVTPAQAKIALSRAGLLSPIEAAVVAAGGEVKIMWDNASVFERNSPLVAALAAQLGLTDEQLDALFLEASKINA